MRISKDPLKLAKSLLDLLETEHPGKFDLKDIKTNELLFKEGQFNRNLYILLDGTIELSKYDNNDQVVKVDWIRPGGMFGVLSFTTGRSTLTFARSKTDAKILTISLPNFERIKRESTKCYELIGQLFIQNLIERYVHIVSMHMELDIMNKQIQSDRNNLQKTLEELHASQSRLINQEKMATLGQLVAGFAHEVNNPASALSNALHFITNDMPNLVKKIPSDYFVPEDLFRWGQNQGPVSTLQTRHIFKDLESKFPKLSRSLIRKIAQLPEEARNHIEIRLGKSSSDSLFQEVEDAIRIIELGNAFKGMSVSANRIGELVKSMKSYARQGSDQYEETDIREGLQDTLLILSNRLKKKNLKLDLNDVSTIHGNVGELNQVWTNIIINSCDATGDGDDLKITCGEEMGLIYVRFEDNGPGVPDEIRERIFEANFTTKNSSGHFGLGLGLAISNQIIKKHKGEIELSRSSELGGAQFTIWLPAD